MDDPELDPVQHRRALTDLARIHQFTNSVSQIWGPIRQRIIASGSRHASILDLGCGDGYMLRRLNTDAKKAGISLELFGCDFSATALETAQRLAKEANAPIEFFSFDVTSGRDLPVEADFVICSLFLHHFDEQQVVAILKVLNAAARHSVLIHDLRRTRLGYVLCWIGVHALSNSPVVRTDGLLSVRAAFTVAEIERLLEKADIKHAKITTGWPQLFTISWSKDEQVNA
jgi:2-polyprenyl-3-methyl-5-hydroxy-6-metoxy-1,4-benzoquinol methylase